MALERGSEANAPLGRAILGGLLAGEPATLFILPALYAVFVKDSGPQNPRHEDPDEEAPTESSGDAGWV